MPSHVCIRFSPDDTQGLAESTWEITNHWRFINQFPANIITSIAQFEMNNNKYVDKKYL